MPAGSKPQGDGLAIIFSAPSGAGKTTLVRHLMTKMELSLGFSVKQIIRLGGRVCGLGAGSWGAWRDLERVRAHVEVVEPPRVCVEQVQARAHEAQETQNVAAEQQRLAAVEKRIAKAQQELEAASAFDLRLVNDDLDLAKQEAEDMVGDFLERAYL